MKNANPPKMGPLRASCLKIAFILPVALLSLSSCEPEKVATPEISYDGIFTVQEANPKDNYLLTLSKKADKANTYAIENLANLVKTPIEGITSGGKLIISEQAFTNYLGDQYTISGDGEIQGETLMLHYSIKGHNGYAGAVFARKQVDGK
jgi:hypothetical protein